MWVAAGLLLLGVIIWFHVPERVISYSADIDENEYQLKGIDLSAHNGKVDFGQVSDAGIDFVILKASEGSRFRDSRFDENYRMAMDSRLYVGAYHFFVLMLTEWCRPGILWEQSMGRTCRFRW